MRLLLLLVFLTGLSETAWSQCHTSSKHIGFVDVLDAAELLQLCEWVGGDSYHLSNYALHDGHFVSSVLVTRDEMPALVPSSGRLQYSWSFGKPTSSGASGTVVVNGQDALKESFGPGYVYVSYDFAHARGLMAWMPQPGTAKLFLVAPGAPRREITLTSGGTLADFAFSKDGKLAVNGEGFVIDMAGGNELARIPVNEGVKRWASAWGAPSDKQHAAASIRFNAAATQVALPWLSADGASGGIVTYGIRDGRELSVMKLPTALKPGDGNTFIATSDLKGFFFLMRSTCADCPTRQDGWMVRNGTSSVICNEGLSANGQAIAKAETAQAAEDRAWETLKLRKRAAAEAARAQSAAASQEKATRGGAKAPAYVTCSFCKGSGRIKISTKSYSQIGGVGTVGRTGYVDWERAPQSIEHVSTSYKMCERCNGAGEVLK